MDVNSHRQRMEDIQKRKAERRKKQIFKKGCIALVFCLLVLFLVVFGISRCTSNMIKRHQEKKAAQVTPTPAPTFTLPMQNNSGLAGRDYVTVQGVSRLEQRRRKQEAGRVRRTAP